MPGRIRRPRSSLFFFFNDTATTEIYTLSLHDALPILQVGKQLAGIDGRGGDPLQGAAMQDRKSTRLNSSHVRISYAVFCLKKKQITEQNSAPHVAKQGEDAQRTVRSVQRSTQMRTMSRCSPRPRVASPPLFFFFLKKPGPPGSTPFPPPRPLRT